MMPASLQQIDALAPYAAGLIYGFGSSPSIITTRERGW